LDLYLNLIENSINKLDNFITDIIHYSRNLAHDISLQNRFHALVKESIESLKLMADAEQGIFHDIHSGFDAVLFRPQQTVDHIQ